MNFGLIGAAGYIAPRHIKAIADTGNNLLVAYDKFDSVGRLDSSFPDCSFYTENEQFDRFCSKQMRTNNPLHWLSICTPNYTHDAFIRYGLRLGCDVICEKPLVLNPYNIDNLVELEKETGHKAYTILQLRLHDKIRALKEKVEKGPKDKIYDVDLTYITSRGNWYYASWKGDVHKSDVDSARHDIESRRYATGRAIDDRFAFRRRADDFVGARYIRRQRLYGPRFVDDESTHHDQYEIWQFDDRNERFYGSVFGSRRSTLFYPRLYATVECRLLASRCLERAPSLGR